MSQKIRICSIILTLAAVGAAITACGGTTAKEDNQTTPVTTANTGETTAAETVEIMPELPQKDYGGRTFTFLTSNENDDTGVDWVTKDIYAAEETGDIITDAVYQRNRWLEEQFNIKIAEYQCVTMAETKKAVTSGVTDYDAVMTGIANGCNMGAQNYILDLQTLPYLDLSASWWDQGLTKDTSIAGRTYIATGDITIVDNDATAVLMFNKQMAANLDYDFYDMVRNNTWDLATMYSCAKSAVKDLNGDGKMEGPNDQFGLATADWSGNCYMYCSGLSLSEKDSEGFPVLKTDTNLLTEVVTAAGAMISDKEVTVRSGQNGISSSDELRYVFEEGRALFFGEVMACVTRMRESETDFGLIPFPKYDLEQDGYHHIAHSTACKGVCVPTTQNDLEMTGIILEAMAAKSLYTVTDAYYDKSLTYKFMRDEESAEMLNIILSTRSYDLAYIYNWGNLYSGIIDLINTGKDNVASTWDKRKKTAEKAMQKTIDAYKENE